MTSIGKVRLDVILFVGVLAVSFSGCAARTQVQKVDAASLKGNLRFENVLFKEFTTVAAATPPPGALSACRESGVAYLRNKGLFKAVGTYHEGAGTASTAVVEAELLDIRIVSTAARAWGGAFSGRSHMRMKVRLVDPAAGTLLAEQELLGAPNAMGATWNFGSSDQQLPVAMGYLIGDFVLANAGKK